MKVLLFLHSFAGGGAERAMVQLANFFVVDKVDVVFVVEDKKGPLLELLDPTIRVVPIFGNRRPGKVFRRLVEVFRISRIFARPDLRGRTTLVTLWKMNLMVSLGHMLSGSKNKLFVREADTLDSLTRNPGLKTRFTLRLMRTMYSRAAGVVANSDATKSDLVNTLGLKPEAVRVIYNPLPVEKFARRENVVLATVRRSTRRILAIGRLAKKKNFEDLILAFGIVHNTAPETELVILGDGPERERLEQIVEQNELGGRVKLPGFVRNVEDFLFESDAFVQTSLWEGFGYVLAEAMLADLPIVAYDSKGAIREIASDSPHVKLVPLGDREGLAKAILQTLREEKQVDHSKLVRDRLATNIVARQYLAYLQENNRTK